MKIALLSTGGTIASKVDPETGKFMSGAQTGEELLSKCRLDKLDKDVEIIVKSVFQIPSNAMTFNYNKILFDTMKELVKEGYEGFVITHGTDTMEESSFFMSLLWDEDFPVVFTGSQFSPTESNTDAFHNISNALLVASSKESKGMGVLVAFNDRIFAAQYVTKMHASNINGFAAPRSGLLGVVDFGRVHYFHKPLHREYYQLTSELPKVEIIKQYIDMDENIVDHYLSQGVKGLVIEGYGRGHTNPRLVEKLQEALDKGIAVVITTTCIDGEVEPAYKFKGSVDDLLSRGAINGRDYMPKKARIKLMVLLAKGIQKDQLQSKFNAY